MKISLDRKNIFFIIVSFCILTSPGLSYSIIYPYHFLFPFVFLFLFYGFLKNNFLANRFNVYLIAFYTYCCFSGLFLKHNDLFFNYLIYLAISFSCMMYIYNFMNLKNYKIIINAFCVYLLVILIISTLESLGIFRLPFSPYSQYYNLFGKSFDTSEWSSDVFLYNTQKPTVFNGNPNTFGFILIVFLPFLFVFKNFFLRVFLFFAAVFVIYKIDSKMILMTFLAFLFLKTLIFNEKRILYLMLFILFLFLLYPLVIYGYSSGFFDGRMFSAISELNKGLEYFYGKSSIDEMDSTGARAYLYSIGFDNFKNTYGVGMGLSGIESYLLNYFGKQTAFHNFFLMILVDLGMLGLFFVILFYFIIIRKLYLGFLYYRGSYLGKIYEAFLFGVLLSIMASITPSGIVYLLPYWFFMGAASFMALKYRNLDNQNIT